MRLVLVVAALSFTLSGCVVVDTAATVADAGVTVASTAVDVTAGTVKTVAHTVTPSDNKKDEDDRRSQ
jgi:uncharacterized protein YceK